MKLSAGTPVDFDENSLAALQVAAQIARQNEGTVLLFHVVPMIIAPTGMPVYVDIYKGQDETARKSFARLRRSCFRGSNMNC